MLVVFGTDDPEVQGRHITCSLWQVAALDLTKN